MNKDELKMWYYNLTGNKWLPRLVLLALMATICLCYYIYLTSMCKISADYEYIFPLPHERITYNITGTVPGLAVIFLAMDPPNHNGSSYQYYAYLSITSLRTTGQYGGEVYLFTNNIKFHNEFKTKANVIDVSNMYLDEIEKLPNNGLRRKIFKTKILYLIPSYHSYVMYCDADILFHRPIENFFYTYLVPIHQYDFLILSNPYYVTHLGLPNHYNSAVFVFRTRNLNGSGADLLDLWGKNVHKLKDKTIRDQTALYYTIHDETANFQVKVLPYNRLVFHINAMDNASQAIVSLDRSDASFVHLAISSMREKNREYIFGFISRCTNRSVEELGEYIEIDRD